MKGPSRTTFLLLIVFIAMLGIAYFVNQSQQNGRVITGAPTPLPEVFPGVDPVSITQIDLEALKGQYKGMKYKLVKAPGEWLITDEKGKPAKVNPAQPSRMIQVLGTLRYNRVMEDADVSKFSLQDGGIFVVSFEAGNSSYTLHIGDLNSAQTYAYVQRGQDPVVLQVPAASISTLLLMFLDSSMSVTPATQ